VQENALSKDQWRNHHNQSNVSQVMDAKRTGKNQRC
jgi:hypothetical protein